MKKYTYVRLSNIGDYEGWNIEKIIERDEKADYHMVVLSKENKPVQKEPYLSEATSQELIDELNKRLKDSDEE